MIFTNLSKNIKENNGIKDGFKNFWSGSTQNITFTDDEITRLKKYYQEVKNTGKTFGTVIKESGDASKSIQALGKAYSETGISEAQMTTAVKTGNVAIQTTGVVSKIASVGVKLLKTTLLSLATIGISFAISKVIELIDKCNHKVDNAKQKIKDVKSSIEEINQTLSDHKKKVDEIGDSYDKLAKGVNLGTLENISLSSDDYKEFINLNNELADMFPSIVIGVNDQGNAILNLGKTGASASSELQKLLKTEQDIANQKINTKLPEYLSNYKTVAENESSNLKKNKETLKNAKQRYKEVSDLINSDFDLFNKDKYYYHSDVADDNRNLYYDAMNKAYDDLYKNSSKGEKDTLDKARSLYDDAFSPGTNINIDFNALDKDQLNALKTGYINYVDEISVELKDAVTEAQDSVNAVQRDMDSAWDGFLNNLVQGMQSKASYAALSESDRQIASYLVRNLNSSVAKEMDENNPYQYVRDNIVTKLGDIPEDKKLQLAEMINGTLPPEKAIEIIQSLQEMFDNLGIVINLDFEVAKHDTYQRVQNSIDQIAKDEKEKQALKGFVQNHGIDKDETKQNQWLNLRATITNADELMEKFISLQTKVDDVDYISSIDDDSISDYISQINELTNYLLTLNKQEELSAEQKVDLNKKYGIVADSDEEYQKLIAQEIGLLEQNSDVIDIVQQALENCNNEQQKIRLESLLDNLTNIDNEALDAAKGFNTLSNAMNTLKSKAELLRSINKTVKKYGKINVDDLKQAITLYPELEDKISEYNAGLITAKELFGEMTKAYEIDRKNYATLMLDKLQYNNEFYNKAVKELPDWVKNMAKSYGIDFDNYKNTCEAKLALQKELAKKEAKLAMAGAILRNQNDSNPMNDDQYKAITDANEDNFDAHANYMKTKQQYHEVLALIDAIDDSFSTSLNFNTSWEQFGKDLDEDKDKKEKNKTEIDWLEQLLTVKKQAEEKAKFNYDNAKVDDKLDFLDDYKNSEEALRDAYTTAANEYGNRVSKSLKGVSDKDKFIKSIKSGNRIDLKKYDEKTGEKIKKAIDYYNKRQEALMQIKELNDTIADLGSMEKSKLNEESYNRQLDVAEEKLKDQSLSLEEKNKLLDEEYKLKKSILTETQKQAKLEGDSNVEEKAKIEIKNEDLNRKLSKFENSQDDNKNTIDLYETLAKDNKISKKDRIKYNDSAQKAVLKDERYDLKKALTNYNDQDKLLKEYNKLMPKNKKKDKITAKDITDLKDSEIKKIVNALGDDSISNLFYKMVNQKQSDVFSDFDVLKQNKDISINFWDNKIKDTENAIAKNNGIGTEKQYSNMKTYYENQKNYYTELKNIAQENRKNATYGTAEWMKWDDIVQEQQDKIQGCNDKIKDCQKSILELPLQKVDEQLNEIKQKLSDINSSVKKENAIVAAAISVYDGQIDTQNKMKEVLQDKIDLLQKEWSLRKQNVEVQKAEWNLQKLKEQKSSLIFKGNGQGWQYEADEAELRNALESVEEARYNQTIANYQNQIDSIDLNIKFLERSKRNWEEINTEAERNVSIVSALKYDNEFINKVLSGDLTYLQQIKTALDEAAIATKQLTDEQTSYEELQDKINYVLYLRERNKLTDEQAKTQIAQIVESYNKTIEGLNISEEKKAEFKKLADDATKEIKVVADSSKDASSETVANIKNAFKTILDVYKELGIDEAISDSAKSMTYSYSEFVSTATKEVDTLINKLNQLAEKTVSISNALGVINSGTNTQSNTLINKPIYTGAIIGAMTGKLFNAEKNHSGVEKGTVGDSSSKDAEKVRLIALDKLKPDEIPRVLRSGELVLNNQNMHFILDNFRTAANYSPVLPQTKPISNNTTVEFTGDIVLQGVQDTNSLAKEIKFNLANALKQEMYKK